MFTSIVLACMIESGVCAGYGGIATTSEADCYAQAFRTTIPWIEKSMPNVAIVAVRCVHWTAAGEPV